MTSPPEIGVRGAVSQPDLIALLVDSPFGSGIYNQVLLCSVPPGRVNINLTLPTRDTPIFGFDSADYAPKSRC